MLIAMRWVALFIRLAPALALAAVMACDLVAPYVSAIQHGVDGPVRDASDAALQPQADAQLDGPSDASSDRGQDSAPAADQQSADTGALAACVAGAAVGLVYGAQTKTPMVTCKGTQPYKQCDAHTLCAPGWHVCTPNQFLARGGKDTPAEPGVLAWLAGCVGIGDDSSLPLSEDVCSTCGATLGSGVVAWQCANLQPLASTVAPVGLAAATSCYRVGANAAESAAYWMAFQASASFISAAVCCE